MRFETRLEEPDFRIGNIVTVNVTRDKGYKHSYRNGRANSGFVLVKRGALVENFIDSDRQEKIRIDPSEVLFVPKGSKYVGIYDEDNTEVKIIQFDLISGELPSYLSEAVKIDLPDICERIERFFAPDHQTPSRHPFYYLSLLYDLLYKINEHYTGFPLVYKRLRPALLKMAEDYTANRSVSYYAGLCEMSEVSFRRLFGEWAGMSPIEYRNELRLKNARTLLQSGEYNVTEAAVGSGFSNLSFFIRLYKKKYGHTPKKEC